MTGPSSNRAVVSKLWSADFGARRMVLDPDDLALTDGKPEPSPADLIVQRSGTGSWISQMMWRSGPTSHQGGRIGLLHDLWGGWLEVAPTHLHKCPPTSIVGYAAGEPPKAPARAAASNLGAEHAHLPESHFILRLFNGSMAVGFQAISWRA